MNAAHRSLSPDNPVEPAVSRDSLYRSARKTRSPRTTPVD